MVAAGVGGRTPANSVAYAMGAVDPIPGAMPNTLIAEPGADWWRVGSAVYLITRESPHTGGR